jgi:beta-fructofuranosidase
MAWFPQNKYIWDFWFAWDHSQQLHLFYLQASQLDCRFNPDARHDRASVGHAILTDWGWQEICPDQPALTRSTERDAWDDLAIWTGSIIQSPLADRYYLFYTSRRKADVPTWTPHEWQRPQNIGVATSRDLQHWQREPNNLVIPNPGLKGEFDGVNWRDPYVIYHAEDHLFYAFICAHTAGNQDAGGIVAYVTSPDLVHWTSAPQVLLTSRDFYQMEVPQIFWRDRGDGCRQLYLLFSTQAKDCSRHWREHELSGQAITGTYYLVSEPLPVEQPIDFSKIPWQGPAKLLSNGFYGGKVIWKNGSNQMVPTLSLDTQAIFYSFQWGDEADHFVGGLADPRAMNFLADGTIDLEIGLVSR